MAELGRSRVVAAEGTPSRQASTTVPAQEPGLPASSTKRQPPLPPTPIEERC